MVKFSRLDEFKTTHSFEARTKESTKIIKKYNDRVPVIVVTADNFQALEKCKFLVPRDNTLAQFMYTIRKRMKLSPQNGLWFSTVSGEMPPCSKTLSEIYKEYTDEDGFLYLKLNEESTFG